jgi:potassium channel subfamily K
MRQIQGKTEAWKRWMRLSIILSIFAVFWLGGACVFWQAEVGASQDLGYGNAVYYSWVTLITIGYGDISPKSVAGRTFFVIWVEFAVPAVTILAQSLTSTVVSTFADSSTMITFALFAKKQTWQNLIDKFPHLFARLPTWLRWKYPDERDLISEKSFEKSSNPVSIKSSENDKGTAAINSRNGPDFNALAEQHNNDLIGQIPDAAALARQLALAIKRAARDMTLTVPRQYGYEEWVEFTRLIRFSAVGGPAEALKEEEDEGLIEWDWLAENSPMMASQNEAEFVLERLCESLVRYLRRNPPRPEFVDRVKEQGEQALRLRSGGFSEEYEPQDVPDPPVSSPRLKKSLMARPSDPTPTTVPATTGNGGGNGDSNSGSGNGGGNGGGNGTSGLGLPPGLRARDLHPVKEEAHDA